MKTFKEFINEGIMDYLKPKSEEELFDTVLSHLPKVSKFSYKPVQNKIGAHGYHIIDKMEIPVLFDDLVELFGEPYITDYQNIIDALNTINDFKWILQRNDGVMMIILDYRVNRPTTYLKSHPIRWSIAYNTAGHDVNITKDDSSDLLSYIYRHIFSKNEDIIEGTDR